MIHMLICLDDVRLFLNNLCLDVGNPPPPKNKIKSMVFHADYIAVRTRFANGFSLFLLLGGVSRRGSTGVLPYPCPY